MAGWGRGGGSDSFPSFSLSLSSRPSVSLAAALLLSTPFPRYALRQPVTFIPASSFPASPRVRVPPERPASLIFLFASPSLIVIRLSADTPTQMISRHFLPTAVLPLPISSQVETICPRSFALLVPKCPLSRPGTLIFLPSFVPSLLFLALHYI